MRKIKKNILNLDDFGSAIGLSNLDKEMIRQKNRIIDILKAARLRLKLSQADLAKLLATKQPSIARMEAGYVGDVSFDFLVRVALVLRVGLEILPKKRVASHSSQTSLNSQ